MIQEDSQSLRSRTEINTKEPQVGHQKGLFLGGLCFWVHVHVCTCKLQGTRGFCYSGAIHLTSEID